MKIIIKANEGNQKEIELYLKKVKELINDGHYTFVPRTKNIGSLSNNGLKISDIKEVLLSLNTYDYCSGPEMDDDYLNQSGIFGFLKRALEGQDIILN